MPRDRSGYFRLAADIAAPKREPTPLERQAIAEVHELAMSFNQGMASITEVRSATSGKQRRLASQFTPPSDAAFRPLMALFDALIADEPNRFATKHGHLEPSDLYEPPGRIVHEDGRQMIAFPVRWPWRVKPDPDRGIEGIRGEPIYRRPEDRAPVYGSFGHPQPTEVQTAKPEWWEAESSESVPF